MSLAGLGEGSLVTVLCNVLVTASPKQLAGDVGSLRGTMNNLTAGVRTEVAGALVVGVLTAGIHRQLDQTPVIPRKLTAKFNLNSVPFITNGKLRSTLEHTSAAPEHVREAGASTPKRGAGFEGLFPGLGGPGFARGVALPLIAWLCTH